MNQRSWASFTGSRRGAVQDSCPERSVWGGTWRSCREPVVLLYATNSSALPENGTDPAWRLARVWREFRMPRSILGPSAVAVGGGTQRIETHVLPEMLMRWWRCFSTKPMRHAMLSSCTWYAAQRRCPCSRPCYHSVPTAVCSGSYGCVCLLLISSVVGLIVQASVLVSGPVH